MKIAFYQISADIDVLLSESFKSQTNKSLHQHKWTLGEDKANFTIVYLN